MQLRGHEISRSTSRVILPCKLSGNACCIPDPRYQLYVHFPCRYSTFALIDSAREGHMSPRSPPQLSHWRFTTALITVTAWSTNERAPHETLSIYETLRLIKTIPTLKENKMLWKYIKRNHIWKGIAKMTHQYVKYSSSSLICTI